MNLNRLIAVSCAAALVLGGAVGWVLVQRSGGDAFADCRRGLVAGGQAQIGGPFELLNVSGETVTEAEVITGPTLIYFGYTFCPDFCPTDMGRNAAVVDDLAERGVDTGLVFVTTDPERDTPEVADDFAKSLHPQAIGLSGSLDAVTAAAGQYKVYFRKSGDDPEYYLMDHSTFTYLMAPEIGFLEFYPSDMGVEEMADSIACFAGKI